MSKEGKFLIYCVESYKNAKGLNGRQVAELFTRLTSGSIYTPASRRCTLRVSSIS